ncbi:uncharacterized protein LOC123310728 [Coccinella septempunctata]|uniref:uncharacterized protein LOC123310728 n=1 Tax=Coccinella septempunctata TaxID=41139 RepID=UPI001D090B34|nr:uncharacterized protein LOC123310728 [Coccinella septempunctata]
MSMNEDPTFNIKFCQVVKKFPCLYNTNLSEYSNRAMQDMAWLKIAEIMEEKAPECKDRWRNLRGRYVKGKNKANIPRGSKRKHKEYYLAPYLNFLDPFLKPPRRKLRSMGTQDTEGGDNENSTDEVESADSEKSEEDSQSGDIESNTKRKRTSSIERVDVNSMNFFDQPPNNNPQQESLPHRHDPLDPDLAFLHSLLPDVRRMNESKKRKFKIAVLKLADQLLNPVTSD